MVAFVLLGVFLLLMIIEVPIAYCLALSALSALLVAGNAGPIIIAQQMYNSTDSFGLLAIPFFILAGGIMEHGGMSERLIRFASDLVGHIKGGIANVAVMAALFFSGISGSAAADTAAVGSVLIPAMKKKGYGKDIACSVMASAGALGIVTLPSVPKILLGATASISVGRLFLGGVIPGIMIAIALMITNYFYARKRNLPVEPKATMKMRVFSFKESFWALFTIVIILGGIMSGLFSATEAAMVAVVYAIFVGKFIYKEFKFSQMPQIIVSSAITTGVVVICIAMATSFAWIMTNEQIPGMMTNALLSVSDNKYIVLLLINVLMLFLGTALDITPVIIITVPIVMPIINQLGIDPVHFGIMTIVNMAIGQMSPPTGASLFVATSIAEVSVVKIIRTFSVYMFAMFVILLLVTFFPIFSTFLPDLVMGK